MNELNSKKGNVTEGQIPPQSKIDRIPFGKDKLPPKLSELRGKLNQKAKKEPKFRFYILFDKVTRFSVLYTAYRKVKANKGAPGVDGVTFAKIEKYEGGLEKYLVDLQRELKAGKYFPQPVKRVYIPKKNGKMRPLGIPTIRDRIVQMAVKLIIEPIFEADFLNCSYGYRPNRSARMAIKEIYQHIDDGYSVVYDADHKGYFDSIPHDKLMKCVEMRIADKDILRLIKLWLEVTVVEHKKGEPPTHTRSDKGTPQGGVISPLLANIYLHWFDKAFHNQNSPFTKERAKLVRFADDFVILARRLTANMEGYIEEKIEGWLGLVINREKTRIVKMHEKGEYLNFLGFEFKYCKDRHKRNKTYLNCQPSQKAFETIKEKIKEMTNKTQCFTPLDILIKRINRILIGWKNYFDYKYPAKVFRSINWYVRQKLYKHLNRRSQRKYRQHGNKTMYEHLNDKGLIYLKSKANSL